MHVSAEGCALMLLYVPNFPPYQLLYAQHNAELADRVLHPT